MGIIKVRKCIQCQKWVLEENAEKVEVSSYYVPPYSATAGHLECKYDFMCQKCIEKLTEEIKKEL